MRSGSLVTFVAVVGIAGALIVRHLPESEAVAEPAPANPVQQIRSIAFDGRELPMSVLRDLLASKVGDSVDSTRLEHDREAIQAELEARGYLAVHVPAPAVTFDDGAYVTFAVDVGPSFHIRKVTLTGASERDAVVTISPGDVAIAQRIERARQAVADTVPRKSGKANVEVKLHTEPRSAVVDVELVVR